MMSRRRFWQHPDGKLYPHPPDRGPDNSNARYRGQQFIKPFVAYRNIVDGEEITTRHAHREFLARNGAEEVGTHREPWQKEYDQIIADGGSDEEAAQVVKEMNNQPEDDGLTEHERGKFDISFEYQDASPAEMEAL